MNLHLPTKYWLSKHGRMNSSRTGWKGEVLPDLQECMVIWLIYCPVGSGNMASLILGKCIPVQGKEYFPGCWAKFPWSGNISREGLAICRPDWLVTGRQYRKCSENRQARYYYYMNVNSMCIILS